MKKPLTEINVGGSHEENSLGGVPMGQGPNGKVNTVEENETKIEIDGSQYIFSDRISTKSSYINNFYLPSYIKGKSFADASKKIEERFKDRTDNASNSTKNKLMSRLRDAQELAKLEKEAGEIGISVEELIDYKEAQAQAAEQEAIAAEQAQGEEQATEEESPEEGQFKYGGTIDYHDGGALHDHPHVIRNGQYVYTGPKTEANDYGRKPVKGISPTAYKKFADSRATYLKQSEEAEALNKAYIDYKATRSTILKSAPDVKGKTDKVLAELKEKKISADRKLKVTKDKLVPLIRDIKRKFIKEYTEQNKDAIVKGDSSVLKPLDEVGGIKNFSFLGQLNDPRFKNIDDYYKGKTTEEGVTKESDLDSPEAEDNEDNVEDVKKEFRPTASNILFPEASTYRKPQVDTSSDLDKRLNLEGIDDINIEEQDEEFDFDTKEYLPAGFDPKGGGSKKGNSALGYAGLAASAAPFIGNLIEGANLEGPESNKYVRAGRTFIPNFADERARLNLVDESFGGSEQAIANASAGNLGAYRANLLGSQVNKAKARNAAFGDINDINRAEVAKQNADFGDAVKEDANLANREILEDKQDEAAFQSAKGQYRKAAYEGLGQLGETIFGISQLEDLSTYNVLGNKKKKDGNN